MTKRILRRTAIAVCVVGVLLAGYACVGNRTPKPSKVLNRMYDSYYRVAGELAVVSNRPSAIASRPAIQKDLLELEHWVALHDQQFD